MENHAHVKSLGEVRDQIEADLLRQEVQRREALVAQADAESVASKTRVSDHDARIADLIAMTGYLLVGSLVGLWKIWRKRPDVIHVHFAVPAGALAWWLSKKPWNLGSSMKSLRATISSSRA